MDFVKYGLIGAGVVWRFHSSGIKNNPKMKIMSVYDIDEKAAAKVAKSLKAQSYKNLEEFFKSDIDAVLILVPHFLHEEMVIRAAEAGKHILCEKPMATTLEGCDQMIAAAKKAGVKFMIAENHRFLPAHRYIHDFVQKGLIGDVFLVRSYEGVNEISGLMKPESWKGDAVKAGGGSLMDMGAHKFATLNWILNDQAENAYAWITKQCTNLPEKAEDNAMIFLKYKKGTIVETVVSFTVVSPPTNQLEIYGTKGTILENHAWEKPLKIFSTHEAMGENKLKWFEPTDIEHGLFPKYYEISFRLEDSHFTDCILNDKEPEFTPEQAKSAIATVLMGYLSVKTSKIAHFEDLMNIYKTKGTKTILQGIEKFIQNNYKK